MNSLAISAAVLACTFGAAWLGMLLRPRIPDDHVTTETKEVVKMVVGIIGTMTGMVLGLLVASAKSSFDGQRDGIAQLAANVVVLDRALHHFGPETREVRGLLRGSLNDMIVRMWPDEVSAAQSKSGTTEPARYEEVYSRILVLEPKTDGQRTTQAQALKVIHDTAQTRWLLYSQRSSSIPPVFLVLLVAWLAITFASFGLFAPRNATAIAVLLLGSLVVSSSVFLILELDHAFGGMIHISSHPLRNALTQIGS